MSYLLHGVVYAGHQLRPADGEPEPGGRERAHTSGTATAGPELIPHRADDPPDLELVEANGLAVVVEPWSDDRVLTEEDAVRHLDVLARLVRGGPVLPLRAGTTAPDTDAVTTELLGPEQAQVLRRRLDAIEDLVELRLTFALDEDTVQVQFNEDAELRELAARSGPDADPSERVELTRRVTEHLAARRAGLIGGWIGTLGELVDGTTSLASSDEGWEQVAFLVRRNRLPELDAAVAELSVQVGARARIEYVGPLPISSFDDSEAALPVPPQDQSWAW